MTGFILMAGLVCWMPGVAESVPLACGEVAMESVSYGRWRFEDALGERIDRNVENWLLRMPGANPGIVEMFRRRDRRLPYANPVPWAGEFAGKYLISAVQALRMSDDPRLKPFVRDFVNQLVASQAENGYLGPFPKDQQLLGQCDLWGHYHCMLGLLMWYDATGDRNAYDCVIRAAACIESVYLEGTRRPIDSGNPNFNLSVLHVVAELYRRTGNPRYLALADRIVEDFPKDGDWLNKGLAGVPHFKLPGSGPRWECLHILQGFATLFEATGDARYKQALVSLWESIRAYDRHPSGAFSTNEQASGTIFAQGSIETCCSVAWMALSIDALRLTGDATAADEIELTLWNQALAAQHPSGDWCTYDTPLNGVRAPSYHQINFQYRPGAPELNCCSVNSPRTLGMLSEWAVMRDDKGLFVNFYGPGTFGAALQDGSSVVIKEETKYPVEGDVRIVIEAKRKAAFAVRFRIPGWSKQTRVTLNGEPLHAAALPGTYLAIERVWKKGDSVELAFDMTPRYQLGEGPDRSGCAAIHVGPLLLAFDAHYNDVETPDLEPIDVANLRIERVPVTSAPNVVHFPPMALWKVETDGGAPALLCDFASAGAHGTDYAAWLRASRAPPPASALKLPDKDAAGAPGPVLFQWSACGAAEDTYELVVARDAAFGQVVAELKGLKAAHATVSEGIADAGVYYWKVRTVNAWATTDNREGPRTFRVDPASNARFFAMREDGLMAASALDGDGTPSYGVRSLEEGLAPAADRHGRAGGALAFAAPGSRLRYKLPFFPDRDYSFMAWACPEGLPSGGAQIFSAWCRGMDDPLRVMINGHDVSARIEAGGGWTTAGVPLDNGKWTHVAAVKEGTRLTLYIDGKPAQTVNVPEYIRSQSTEVGIGFNPLFSGGEHFTGKLGDFAFYARALSPSEIEKAYQHKG